MCRKIRVQDGEPRDRHEAVGVKQGVDSRDEVSHSERLSNLVEFEFRVRVRVSSKFCNFKWIKTVELPT